MKKAVKKPRVTYFTLDRVYRVLPFVFIVMSVFNVWFLYSYVRSDRERVDFDRAEMLSSVSNVYNFVMLSLSNQVEQVRFRNSVIARSIVSPSTNFAVSVQLPPSNVVHDVQSSISPERLTCWYSICHGFPCVTFGGCRYYQVGDDFGFGEIDRITRLFVFCGGVRYRLSEPPVPLLPRADRVLVGSQPSIHQPQDLGVFQNDRVP